MGHSDKKGESKKADEVVASNSRKRKRSRVVAVVVKAASLSAEAKKSEKDEAKKLKKDEAKKLKKEEDKKSKKDEAKKLKKNEDKPKQSDSKQPAEGASTSRMPNDEGDEEDSWLATLDPTVQNRIRSLKRKVERRDKKVTVANTELKGLKEDLEAAQVAKERYTREADEREAALEKEKQNLAQELAQLKEKDSKKSPSGWAKKHANSQGKKVPSQIGEEMATRLRALSQSRNDYVEIKKGDFVRFLAGARCLGYYEEAGTNILLPRNTVVPEMIKDLAVKKAKESLKRVTQKGKFGGDNMKMLHLFTEIATALHYSLVGDHQAPIYINDRPVELKLQWVKNEVYTATAIMVEQPIIVREFLETAMKSSGIVVLDNTELKKEVVVATLKLIIQNNRKQGLGTHGSERGRAHRKLTVPEEMWPGNEIVNKNVKLLATFDRRTQSYGSIDWVSFNIPYEREKKVIQNEAKGLPSSPSSESAHHGSSSGSDVDGKRGSGLQPPFHKGKQQPIRKQTKKNEGMLSGAERAILGANALGNPFENDQEKPNNEKLQSRMTGGANLVDNGKDTEGKGENNDLQSGMTGGAELVDKGKDAEGTGSNNGDLQSGTMDGAELVDKGKDAEGNGANNNLQSGTTGGTKRAVSATNKRAMETQFAKAAIRRALEQSLKN